MNDIKVKILILLKLQILELYLIQNLQYENHRAIKLRPPKKKKKKEFISTLTEVPSLLGLWF